MKIHRAGHLLFLFSLFLLRLVLKIIRVCV